MSSLTALIALSFLTLIVTLLAVWLTLTVGERAARAARSAQERPERQRSGPGRLERARRRELDNDAVRGARAPRKNAPVDAAPLPPSDGDVRVLPRERGSGQDAFDRFLDPPGRRNDF